MPGPWEQYQRQPAPQQPAQPAPTTIGGTRVLGGVPASEQRAQQDQAIQMQQVEMQRQNQAVTQANEAERIRLAQQSQALSQQNAERAAQADRMGSESERTAGFLAGRVVDAIGRLTTAVSADRSAERPTLGVEMARTVFGDTAANYLTDEQRQQVRASQIDILDAALTLGTGAAYTQEQIEGYRQAYFAQLGDSEETIASKREALRSLLANAATKAGRAAPDIERAIAQIDALDGRQQTQGGSEARQNDDEGGLTGSVSPIYYDGNGNEVGPDYTGPAYDAEGNLYGTIGRNSDSGEREWVRPEVRQLNEQWDRVRGAPGASDMLQQSAMMGLGDEASGVGQAIGRALTGDFNIAENYRLGRDAEQFRLSRAEQSSGALGTAASIVGGLGGVAGRAGSLMRAGRAAAASPGGLSANSLRSATVRQAARDGAVVGGIGGFGYGEGFENSTSNALVGALGGAALGAGAQRIGNALANRPTTRSAAQETVQAAGELGVDVLPSMTGGPVTRALTAGARQSFISGAPIANATDTMQAQAGAARTRIASEVGRPVNAEDAGELVRQAANVYSRRTGDIGGRLYDRATRLAGDTKVPLATAVQRADELLAELGQAPGGGGAIANDIRQLREQMAAGEFTPAGIRQMRTVLRDQMQLGGLRGSNTDRMLGQIADAAEQDMITGLQNAGRENAAAAYQTASRFWRDRVETIDQVLEPVLGRNASRSGEQVLAGLERLARPDSGNSARLRRLMDSMPREEAANVRASVINRLGRPSRGAGEVVDESGFSLERFLTQWNDMSPRARAVMFPRSTVEQLDQLATVAAAAKRAGTANNTSNTAGAIGVQSVLSGGQLWAMGPLWTGASAGLQYGAGKLLASPRFARWLAGSIRVTQPRAREAYMARLGDIARAEPAIAAEIERFRSAAMSAANDNVGRVAAEEQPPAN